MIISKAIVPDGWPCTLDECRQGLFLYQDTLCLRTEDQHVFICENGEYFWNGADSPLARLKLIVQPCVLQTIKHAGITEEDRRLRDFRAEASKPMKNQFIMQRNAGFDKQDILISSGLHDHEQPPPDGYDNFDGYAALTEDEKSVLRASNDANTEFEIETDKGNFAKSDEKPSIKTKEANRSKKTSTPWTPNRANGSQ